MRRLLQILACVAMAACSGSSSDSTSPPPPIIPPPPPAPVATLAVTAIDSIVFVGDSMELHPIAYDSMGQETTGHAVTWTGGNAFVTVDENGKTRGIAPGATTITATSEGHSAAFKVRSAYGATLTDGGGTISYPGHVSILFGPSSVKNNSRLALISTADPDAAVPNNGITIFPGSFVMLAQTPRNTFQNYANNSTITFSYLPSQLPPGVTALNLVRAEWIPAVTSPVGLIPGWTVVDSNKHTLSVVFTNPQSKHGLGYVANKQPLTISASQDSVSIPRGGSADVPIAIVRNNSTDLLTFTTSNAQSGITQLLTPQSTAGNSTTLQLSVAGTATPGSYLIIVYATPGGVQTRVILTVTAP